MWLLFWIHTAVLSEQYILLFWIHTAVLSEQYILLFYRRAMREDQLTLTLARYFLLEQAQRLKLLFPRKVVSTTSARRILAAAVRIRLLIRLRMLLSLQAARLSQSVRDSPSA